MEVKNITNSGVTESLGALGNITWDPWEYYAWENFNAEKFSSNLHKITNEGFYL